MFPNVLNVICIFLITTGFLFIIIELRAHIEKSFLAFGLTDILISCFCLIDINFNYQSESIFWTIIQHILASFFPALILLYLYLLLNKQKIRQVQIFLGLGIGFSLLFASNAMFLHQGHEVISTILYNATFVPFILCSIVCIMYFFIANTAQCAENDKKILFYHMIGIGLLGIGGLLDLVIITHLNPSLKNFVSFTTPGALAFGLVVTYVFAVRMSIIIRDRENLLVRLRQSYKELEEAHSLEEVGQLASVINHEVKNYTFAISCSAKEIGSCSTISREISEIAAQIDETACRLFHLNADVLQFSNARRVDGKQLVNSYELVRNTIQLHFPGKKDAFHLDGLAKETGIFGDKEKLEHVFVNIFKNAFEAGASTIRMHSTCTKDVVLIMVDDDGIGCSAEQMGFFFKSFYTTKKKQGGTGLGTSIAKSIIEAHGGAISVYSKNLLQRECNGLVLNMTFPPSLIQEQELMGYAPHVILMRSGIPDLPSVLRIFRNCKIAPCIINDPGEIVKENYVLEKSIIYGMAHSVAEYKKKIGVYKSAFLLEQAASNIIFCIEGTERNFFSENQVLKIIDHTSRLC